MHAKPFIAVAALVGSLCAATITAATTTAAATAGTAVPSQTRKSFTVGVADYTLGDTAFTYPGLDYQHPGRRAPIELTGRVYYPVDHSRRQHPMVVLLHGLWVTCADRDAATAAADAQAKEAAWSTAHPGTKQHPGEPNPDQARLDAILDRSYQALDRWPCATGTPALPSYLGYDYLARELAAHGITAVSISANGINAVGLGDTAVAARGALINRHLALWADLVRTGGGPLAGHFTQPGSHRRIAVDFRHRIDLADVGTLGHSRGGKAVFWQAADLHRKWWPTGVTVRAMVSLAPEGADEVLPGSESADEAGNYRVTRLPFLTWIGTCDGATGTGGLDYVAVNARVNRRTDYLLAVHGANHNFLNRQWSPASGQVGAEDDVTGTEPGRCTETSPALPLDRTSPQSVDGRPNAERALTETAERRVAAEYVVAFFLRELKGQTRWDPMLAGAIRPLRAVARTDAIRLRAH